MVVDGEAGIGKTALVGAACERAAESNLTVLSARAGELETEFAWGVVRQLFDGPVARALIEEHPKLLDGAAALARPSLGIEKGVNQVDASFATLHGLYWLTVNLAQHRPTLLVIDDLHWADLPSLRFVEYLLPRIGEIPIMLLLASRSVGLESTPGGDLLMRIVSEPTLGALHPRALSDAATMALVHGEMSRDASEDFCLACHTVSGGNPFLLRALLAELADEQVVPNPESVAHVLRLTPTAVTASVLLRLARLPKEALELARAVAILGASTEIRLARQIPGLSIDEATEAAAALIHAGILVDDKTLTFVHPLVGSAVYGDLAGPERSRWHHSAARLLVDDDAPRERIASHLIESLPNGDSWTSSDFVRSPQRPRPGERWRSPATVCDGPSLNLLGRFRRIDLEPGWHGPATDLLDASRSAALCPAKVLRSSSLQGVIT